MDEMPETGPAATSLEDKSPGPAPASAPERPAAQAPPVLTRPRRRGKRLLIGLFAVSVAVAVAAAAVTAVLLLAHGPHRPRTAAHPLRATVFGLRPGQCFNSLPNGIAGAHVVPCAQPHDGEIYGTFRVAGRDWPGSGTLASQARLGCQARLTGYLNPQLDTSGLAESYAYPNQGAWAAGEHSVICEIRGTQGKLTGSVRAASP
jgi:putative regulator of septum formation